LYFRLAVVTIDLPPLRERLEDLEALASHFVSKYCRELDLPK
jgi:two-component system nitrogen regulation response regulator GlnG